MTPNTYYKVTIRAKNIKASPYVDEKNLTTLLDRLSAHTDFRTLDKGCPQAHAPSQEALHAVLSLIAASICLAMPDPPMDVRVDGGPQDGTLLVTWIPVAGNRDQLNRLAPVTGYAVFADGKRVTDVDSPTSKDYYMWNR